MKSNAPQARAGAIKMFASKYGDPETRTEFKCPRCEKVKPIGDFPLVAGKRRGYCKPCRASYHKQWQNAYKAKHGRFYQL